MSLTTKRSRDKLEAQKQLTRKEDSTIPGTIIGGRRAAATNRKKYGEDFYSRIGKKGGTNSKLGGFASDKVGADGLTGRQRARIAGKKGGMASRRGPSKKDPIDEAERILEEESGRN